jgi:hypothetical protein
MDQYGAVYLVCLHPQWMKRGHANRHLIGQVPLSLLGKAQTRIVIVDQSCNNVSDGTSHLPSRVSQNAVTRLCPQHHFISILLFCKFLLVLHLLGLDVLTGCYVKPF